VAVAGGCSHLYAFWGFASFLSAAYCTFPLLHFNQITMDDELNIAASFEVTEALSPEEFQQKIDKIRDSFPGHAHPLFLLFTGSKIKSRGEGEGGGLISWCPDCTRAAPVVFATLEEFAPNSVLLILNCERAEYKDLSFTYRENPSIALTSVPTLIRYADLLESNVMEVFTSHHFNDNN